MIRRIGVVVACCAILADDMAVIPLYVEPMYVAVPAGVGGLAAEDFRFTFTGNVEYWYLTEE